MKTLTVGSSDGCKQNRKRVLIRPAYELVKQETKYVRVRYSHQDVGESSFFQNECQNK